MNNHTRSLRTCTTARSRLIILAFILFTTSSAYSATVNVSVLGLTFSPSTVDINEGDTVQWNWIIGIHTITSGASPTAPDVGSLFDVPNDSNNITFSHTYNAAGTYPYFCSPHFSFNMTGTINVVAVEVLDPTHVYVNTSSNATEIGTENFPFKTITAAIAVADPDAIIDIVAGTYIEDLSDTDSFNLSTSMKLQVNGSGTVGIGVTLPSSVSGFHTRTVPLQITSETKK